MTKYKIITSIQDTSIFESGITVFYCPKTIKIKKE